MIGLRLWKMLKANRPDSYGKIKNVKLLTEANTPKIKTWKPNCLVET